MNRRTEEAAELLAAAERDWKAFLILERAPDAPVEILLFHAQQAAEKCIKAVLASQGIFYRRTHDLVQLIEISATSQVEVPVERGVLVRLSPYAVDFRYLGATAPAVSVAEAGAAVNALIAWARSSVTP
jgi:HEPN domain-containing protein